MGKIVVVRFFFCRVYIKFGLKIFEIDFVIEI